MVRAVFYQTSKVIHFWRGLRLYVTRSRKRDRLQIFVNIAFLVWIVSATNVEYNGSSLEF